MLGLSVTIGVDDDKVVCFGFELEVGVGELVDTIADVGVGEVFGVFPEVGEVEIAEVGGGVTMDELEVRLIDFQYA